MGEGTRHDSLNHKLVDGRPVDNSGNFLDDAAADATTDDANAADATSYHRWGDEDPLPEPGSGGESDNPSIEELRDQIEQTRAEMTDTVDALADKLNPEVIKAQVKDATLGKVQEVAETVKEKALDLAVTARDKAQVLAGAASVKAHELAEVAGDKIQEAKERAAERADDMAQRADDASADYTTSSGLDGVPEEDIDDDTASAHTKLRQVRNWVRQNPVPVVLGVTGLLFFLARRRSGPQHDETYIVEIVD
ncbi:MAG: hypothetical protein JWN98_824 [Abditibacteriota bacterium]|nr:hypothetical protein [Abditibacteriota bacterium]